MIFSISFCRSSIKKMSQRCSCDSKCLSWPIDSFAVVFFLKKERNSDNWRRYFDQNCKESTTDKGQWRECVSGGERERHLPFIISKLNHRMHCTKSSNIVYRKTNKMSSMEFLDNLVDTNHIVLMINCHLINGIFRSTDEDNEFEKEVEKILMKYFWLHTHWCNKNVVHFVLWVFRDCIELHGMKIFSDYVYKKMIPSGEEWGKKVFIRMKEHLNRKKSTTTTKELKKKFLLLKNCCR